MINLLKNSIFRRVITSLLGLPVLAFFLYVGGWPLICALFVLSVIGMYEFYKALSGEHKLIHYVGYVFAGIYYLILALMPGSANGVTAITVTLISFTLVTCVITVIRHESVNVRDAAITYFGFCYITVLLSTVYLTTHRNGVWLAAIAFISAWGCDTGAYIIGKTLGKSGKHKLVPKLSPNKTVEGAVGGTLTGALLTAIFGLTLYETRKLEINLIILIFTILGAVCSIFSQLGDLFASTIKRHTGIKDFGSILPGHGGVIDRFDSVLFTAPILYLMTFFMLR